MCGITGFWHFTPNHQNPYKIIQSMTHTLKHRGPDDQKTWVHENASLALGHTRLSIRDLSSLGSQPMRAQQQNNWIVFNGEIYNADDIRRRLEENNKITCRGQSDTEVFLEACSAWGVKETCQQANGMFAFAFWREQGQTLTLARDRMGKKPLFWGMKNNTLVFASELKSIYQHPKWTPQMSQHAVKQYFELGYVPCPMTIDEHIQKLEPAHIITIKPNQSQEKQCYWDFDQVAVQLPSTRSTQEQQQWLREELTSAVKRRMIADVPLGAFLSGGIDSSLIVSVMQKESTKKIKTFSIGFEDTHYNESDHAKAVANHLGTDHHEMIFSGRDASHIAQTCAYYYDEPFSDSSMLPTMLVSAMAREHVSVALTGDGGDELFAGYNRYHIAHRLWQKSQYLPNFSKHWLSNMMQKRSVEQWDQLAKAIPKTKRPKRFGQKIHKLASVLPCQNPKDYYQMLVHNELAHTLCPDGRSFQWPTHPDLDAIAHMQWLDTKTYLMDDILTKVDRASMAFGLEARAPLLDFRIVELAWRIPMKNKIQNKKSKWILQQLLADYIPKPLFDRPKMGFGIPLDNWLRSHLKPWADELIISAKEAPFINSKIAMILWQEHLQGHNHQEIIWRILMYLAWIKQWSSAHHSIDNPCGYVMV